MIAGLYPNLALCKSHHMTKSVGMSIWTSPVDSDTHSCCDKCSTWIHCFSQGVTSLFGVHENFFSLRLFLSCQLHFIVSFAGLTNGPLPSLKPCRFGRKAKLKATTNESLCFLFYLLVIVYFMTDKETTVDILILKKGEK